MKPRKKRRYDWLVLKIFVDKQRYQMSSSIFPSWARGQSPSSVFVSIHLQYSLTFSQNRPFCFVKVQSEIYVSVALKLPHYQHVHKAQSLRNLFNSYLESSFYNTGVQIKRCSEYVGSCLEIFSISLIWSGGKWSIVWTGRWLRIMLWVSSEKWEFCFSLKSTKVDIKYFEWNLI